jgi:SAM-dependent methyltransferase
MGTAQVQGELWGARPREWSELQEGACRPLYEAAFDAARLGDGTDYLDVGCGAGLACQVARQRGAKVSGLDAAAPLLAIARSRCPEADLRAGEMEELPFADRSFDVITGFNSFQYAADPVHALAEARRVAQPEGRVVVAVWGAPEKCELAHYLVALGRLMPPAPPGAPGPFALSAAGALEALVERAGLQPAGSGTAPVVMRFEGDDAALRGLLASGPATRAIRHSSEAAACRAVAGAISPYRQGDGSYVMRNEFKFLVSRPRPGAGG